MKWRPRISIPLGKGIRINIGKRGIGGSAGIPGVARFGIGTDGRTRTTVGKGLFRWEKQGGRVSGCGCGGCLGMVVIGVLVLLIVGAFLPKTPNDEPLRRTNSPATPARPLSAPQIPLFRQPAKAAALPLELGLTDTAPDRAAWRQSPDGWYGLASLTTYTGKLEKVGDIDNTITCHHESTNPAHVHRVTWTANVFNPDGHAATLPKFRELCLQYTARLGCPVPDALFFNVSPETGQQLETDQASFSIEKLDFERGVGWRFRITSK